MGRARRRKKRSKPRAAQHRPDPALATRAARWDALQKRAEAAGERGRRLWRKAWRRHVVVGAFSLAVSILAPVVLVQLAAPLLEWGLLPAVLALGLVALAFTQCLRLYAVLDDRVLAGLERSLDGSAAHDDERASRRSLRRGVRNTLGGALTSVAVPALRRDGAREGGGALPG